MDEKDKNKPGEKAVILNLTPSLLPDPLTRSSISTSSSVPAAPIPPAPDNLKTPQSKKLTKATAVDAMVIKMGEKNLQPDLEAEQKKTQKEENFISSSLEKMGQALGLPPEKDAVSENSQEEQLPQENPISSGLKKMGQALGLSPEKDENPKP